MYLIIGLILLVLLGRYHLILLLTFFVNRIYTLFNFHRLKQLGEGRAVVMYKGQMLDAFWKRGSNLDPFHIVDKNGQNLFIPPGKPWISLVPNNYSPTFDN